MATYLGLGLLYVATALPFVIWMMLNFIDEVPFTLEHAARLLGSGCLYTLRRIVLPLVASGMGVTFLFIFILKWQRVPPALTLTQPGVSTLPVLLNKFQSAVEGRLYGPQAAIGSLITLPVVILGMRIQKHLITGFSFGMMRKSGPGHRRTEHVLPGRAPAGGRLGDTRGTAAVSGKGRVNFLYSPAY